MDMATDLPNPRKMPRKRPEPTISFSDEDGPPSNRSKDRSYLKVRYHIISLSKAGAMRSTIANTLGVSLSTVYRVLRLYKTTGDLERERTKTPGGRNILWTDDEVRFVYHVMLCNRDAPPRHLARILVTLGKRFTEERLDAMITDMNLRLCVAHHIPPLKTSATYGSGEGVKSEIPEMTPVDEMDAAGDADDDDAEGSTTPEPTTTNDPSTKDEMDDDMDDGDDSAVEGTPDPTTTTHKPSTNPTIEPTTDPTSPPPETVDSQHPAPPQ
ncbi:hypothetical protein DFS34DRAFT_600236 [Phlyctochytrium arcticum]|nr:hypothetical protein DFS34DRAFT_600236 [Phlyctochytrium arcticum]